MRDKANAERDEINGLMKQVAERKLAELSGYGISRYNDILKKKLFDFAIAYGIVDFSKYDFTVETVSISRAQ